MTDKRALGQFYTKNYDYILQNMCVPPDVARVIEPFCGEGDLLKMVPKTAQIEKYDIAPQKEDIIKRDTLADPPDYKGSFVITNPPYLARNKAADKTYFNKYGANDLYKCFIKTMNGALGAILIVPLNFWCSMRKNDIALRANFLQQYNVLQINIFEERVFDDTSYAVCAFRAAAGAQRGPIKITIYPEKKTIEVFINKKNNYTIGGKLYLLETNANYKIMRAAAQNEANTRILCKCIDDNTPINLSIGPVFVDKTPKQSERSFCTLVIEPSLSDDEQIQLVQNFNEFLQSQRKKYHSLFLPNYREGRRKRISFDLIYRICGHLLRADIDALPKLLKNAHITANSL
ncbi:MAG: Eco57I restriction-modification methylase domain-containing protein [Acidimicrobiales bacterium]